MHTCINIKTYYFNNYFHIEPIQVPTISLVIIIGSHYNDFKSVRRIGRLYSKFILSIAFIYTIIQTHYRTKLVDTILLCLTNESNLKHKTSIKSFIFLFPITE